MKIVEDRQFRSVAFPVIGAGSGGFDEDKATALMLDALTTSGSRARTVIVRYSVSNREDR